MGSVLQIANVANSKPENVTALSLVNGLMIDGQPNWWKNQQRPYFISIYKEKKSEDSEN